MLTSQLPVAMWHEAIGEPTVADSILDRLTSDLVRVEMSGESMRRALATAAKQARRRTEEAEGAKRDASGEPRRTELVCA